MTACSATSTFQFCLLTLAALGASRAEASDLTVNVTRDFTPPAIEFQPPDLTAYTPEKLRATVPTSEGGRVAVAPAEDERLLEEALRSRPGEDARVIEVADGVVSLAGLVDQLADPAVAERSDKITTVRLPILVRPGATLVIDGRETPTVHLSADQGVFVINAGTLHVIDAEVTGWEEAAGKPSQFENKKRFRPYLASLVRSETYLFGSRFACLGFAAPTSYGVSFSTQPERAHGEPTKDSPTGTIAGCTFDNLYYGFYSYEARDIAIVGSTYTDNIVYAIDPHDRTTRLLIAGNTTTGTREKHGIIGSRGVSDSVIYDNTTHGNGGSGIMLDRECSGCTIAGNRVYDNNQGIAIYESSGNRLVDNTIGFNNSCALRVRNSVDIIAIDNAMFGSGDYAIDVTARPLADADDRAARGEQYELRAEVALHGVRASNNYGFAKATGLGKILLSGIVPASDADTLAQEWGVEPSEDFDIEQSRRFGSQLKPLSYELEAAFDYDAPLVEVVDEGP